MVLHEPTLGIVYVVAAVLAFLVLFALWRINRDTPGTGLWTVAAVATIFGFVVLPLRPVVGTPVMAFLNNMAAVVAILLIIEGIILFRDLSPRLLPRKVPRRFVSAAIVLLSGSVTVVTIESARLRALFLDPLLILLLLVVAVVLVYRTRGMERYTHLIGAVSAFLLAATLMYRFVLALQGDVPADTTGTQILSLVLFVGFIWTVGITVGLAMAVNYRKQQLLLAEKLRAERATELRSRFLAHMSHEVRTPLNALVGVAQMLRESELAAEQREEAEMIHTSASSLLTVINSVLDLSKIEAEQITLEERPFDPRELAQEVVTVFQFQADEKGLHLTHVVDDRVPARLLGDIGRLRQVLVNLVGNAVKFTDHGEVVLQMNVDAQDGKLRCAVRDTGPGIPESKQQDVFDSFVQVQDETVRRSTGTGLGLAISSQLVKLMGGTLAVDSEVGRGSIFHFAIPLQVAPEAGAPEVNSSVARPPEKSPLSEYRQLNVLLADDERINRRITERVLQNQGFTVTAVADGEEVLREHGQQRYDLVLMDVEMPVMDGLEATAQIREREREASIHTPVVAMTAHDMPGDRERFISAGMDEYLTKPLEPEELLSVVGSVVGAQSSK